MSRLYIVTLLITVCAEYIMRNALLDETHVGIDYQEKYQSAQMCR